MNELIVEKKKV